MGKGNPYQHFINNLTPAIQVILRHMERDALDTTIPDNVKSKLIKGYFAQIKHRVNGAEMGMVLHEDLNERQETPIDI